MLVELTVKEAMALSGTLTFMAAKSIQPTTPEEQAFKEEGLSMGEFLFAGSRIDNHEAANLSEKLRQVWGL